MHNTLRIIFLIMIMVETSLVSYIFAKKSKNTKVVNIFLLYISINTLWFINQLMIISPMINTENAVILLKVKSFFWTAPTIIYALFIIRLTKTNIDKFIYTIIFIDSMLFLYTIFDDNVINSFILKNGFFLYKSNIFTMIIPSLNIIPMFLIYFILIKKYNRNISYTKPYLILFILSLISFLIIPLSHMDKLTLSIAIPIWSFVNSIVTFIVVKKLFLSIDYEGFTNGLFSNIHDAVLITNKQNEIIVTNKLAEKIISDILNIDLMFVKLDEIFEDYDCNQSYKNKKFKFKAIEQEVMISQSIISNKESEFKSIIIIKDLSSEKLLQEELITNQKLQSLSVFIGGVAHDFGNILTAILGNISYLKMKLDFNNDDIKETIKETENIIIQAKNLTKQLLDYSKTNQQKNNKNISITTIIESSISLALSGSSILVEKNIESNPYKIYGDKIQLEQVFNNLFINAKQAIKEQGKISIKIKKILIESQYIQFIKPGKYLEITIKDNGKGIPKETLHEIFTPYFTTKENGNGLGLAIVSSIIKNHDGYINVDSEINKGTTFTIYLPASNQEEQNTEEDIKIKKQKTSSNTIKTNKVLIMDDEEMILKISEKLLKVLNYDVVLAKNGTEVLNFLKNNKDANISTYILDLTIPGDMGGKELAPKLKEINQEARIIISSGYSNKDEVVNYKNYSFDDKLIKPYTIEDLKNVLERNNDEEE